MELDRETEHKLVRAVEHLGLDTRKASSEQKRYTDAMADGVRDELRRELRTRMDGLERKQARELEQVECALRRGGMTGEVGNDGTKKLFDANAPETKAFELFVRHGADRLSETERKALSVSTDPSGGYLVPATVAPQIIYKISQFSPIRQLSTNVSTGGDKIDHPVMTSSPVATWVSEVETRPETTATFGDIEIKLGKLA